MSEFQQLVDANYQALFRFAMSMTRDSDRACDLVQETFCRWAEKGDQLRDRSKAKTWLFTTLHREFLSVRRKASRYSDEPVDAMAERLSEENEEPERQMDGQRALELLGGLDENYRAPLALFTFSSTATNRSRKSSRSRSAPSCHAFHEARSCSADR